jgi:hypothetical protein
LKRAHLLTTLTALTAVALCAAVPAPAAGEWEMPTPTKEHKWLQQFVGEWTSNVTIYAEPGKPPMQTKSTEKVRALGGFWVISESKSKMMGMPYTIVFTVGYDAAKKKYIGTWVDSGSSTFWRYEGVVDSTGKKLVLETEGPNMLNGTEMAKFREVTEFKSKDHKVFASSMWQGGKWVTLTTIDSWRKKSK